MWLLPCRQRHFRRRIVNNRLAERGGGGRGRKMSSANIKYNEGCEGSDLVKYSRSRDCGQAGGGRTHTLLMGLQRELRVQTLQRS
jgi:hypothetical protein